MTDRRDEPGTEQEGSAHGPGGSHTPWWSRPDGDSWAPHPETTQRQDDRHSADEQDARPDAPSPMSPESLRGASGNFPAGAMPAWETPSYAGSRDPGGAGGHAAPPGSYPWYAPGGSSPWGAPGVDTLGRDEARPRRPRAWLLVTLALAMALISGGLGGAAGFTLAERRNADVIDGQVSLGGTVAGTTQREAGTVAGVATRLLPSVVSFEVRTGEGRATGSGFVIREDGYILTNNHVVRGAAAGQGSISVQFSDGSIADAEIVGRDGSYDLAVVKVSGRNLPVVRFGDSDAVVPGDPVIAIGSPLGLSGTVTSGIVSALDRPVTAGGQDGTEASFISAIQTDAAINPGNSGGPLVNLKGEVVGVNSAIATLSGGPLGIDAGSIGLGFAIPMNQAKVTAEQLINGGRATHPIIGVVLDPSQNSNDGARVAGGTGANGQQPVSPGGPADVAGIEPGDVIVSIDGRDVADSADLIVAIRSKRPGDVVELTVRRGSQEREVRVTLGESSD